MLIVSVKVLQGNSRYVCQRSRIACMGGMRIFPIAIHPFVPSWRLMLTILMNSRDVEVGVLTVLFVEATNQDLLQVVRRYFT